MQVRESGGHFDVAKDHMVAMIPNVERLSGKGEPWKSCSSLESKPGVSWCYYEGTDGSGDDMGLFCNLLSSDIEEVDGELGKHGFKDDDGNTYYMGVPDPAARLNCYTTTQWDYNQPIDKDYWFGYSPMCHFCKFDLKTSTMTYYYNHCKDSVSNHFHSVFEQKYWYGETTEGESAPLTEDVNHCHWSWKLGEKGSKSGFWSGKKCPTMGGSSYAQEYKDWDG